MSQPTTWRQHTFAQTCKASFKLISGDLAFGLWPRSSDLSWRPSMHKVATHPPHLRLRRSQDLLGSCPRTYDMQGDGIGS